MNEYVVELTLDIDCRNTLPTIRSGRYDKGRKCLIHITADDQPYSASGCIAVIKGRRHDKSYFSESCTVDNSGNVILTLSESILAVNGCAYAKIVLSDATHTYSTQIFVVDVDSGLEGDVSDIDSFSVFNDCLNTLAVLLGVEDIAETLSQYLTTDDIIEDNSSVGHDNVFSSYYAKNQFVPVSRTLAGLNLSRDRSAWEIVQAIISGIIIFGNSDKGSTETYTGGLNTLPYHVNSLYINISNRKAWVCTAIDSQSGNPPYVMTWAPVITNPPIPTKTSDLTNDSGFLTAHQDISGKMNLMAHVTSTAQREGLSDGQIFEQQGEIGVTDENTDDGYTLLAKKNNIPTKTSDLVNDSGFLTAHQDISGKADKATALAGYGITDAYTKTQVDSLIPTVPTKTSDLTNDSGFLTQHQDISGKMNLMAHVNTAAQRQALSDGQLFEQQGEYGVTDSGTNDGYALLAKKSDIPTKTSDLTNDSGFLTSHQDISGKMNLMAHVNTAAQRQALSDGQLFEQQGEYGVTDSGTNDGYALLAKKSGIPTKTSDLTNDSGFLSSHQDISGKMNLAATLVPTVSNAPDTSDSSYTSMPDGQIFKCFITGYLTYWIKHTAYPGTAAESPSPHRLAFYDEIPSVSGKENTANKVTSLSASSTDTEYPSAKCVYDMIGDIESLLNSLL